MKKYVIIKINGENQVERFNEINATKLGDKRGVAVNGKTVFMEQAFDLLKARYVRKKLEEAMENIGLEEDPIINIEEKIEQCRAEFVERVFQKVTESIKKEKGNKSDSVNNPKHYADTKIETIDYIEDKLTKDGFQGYLEGNIIKYVSRYRKKGGVEDLQKARWYLDRLIEKEQS